MKFYVLEGESVKEVFSGQEWAAWLESADRVVRQDRIGQFFVSTVFLGIDHRWSGEGPPILFETMIFDERAKAAILEYQERGSSWDEAIEMHERAKAFAEIKAREA